MEPHVLTFLEEVQPQCHRQTTGDSRRRARTQHGCSYSVRCGATTASERQELGAQSNPQLAASPWLCDARKPGHELI